MRGDRLVMQRTHTVFQPSTIPLFISAPSPQRPSSIYRGWYMVRRVISLWFSTLIHPRTFSRLTLMSCRARLCSPHAGHSTLLDVFKSSLQPMELRSLKYRPQGSPTVHSQWRHSYSRFKMSIVSTWMFRFQVSYCCKIMGLPQLAFIWLAMKEWRMLSECCAYDFWRLYMSWSVRQKWLTQPHRSI